MRFRPYHLTLAAIIAVLVMVALVTGGQRPGTIASDGDLITKTVSLAQPSATATFDIVLQEGGDAAHESTHIFEALENPAIAELTLDTSALTLQVTYDGNVLTEDDVRRMLAASGYVGLSAADATPAELSADGTTQAIYVTAGETLAPSLISAKAGVPLTITFSAGTGHLVSVSIPSLGLSQQLAAEGSTIEIPAPAVGTYDLVCAEGYTDATLIVE